MAPAARELRGRGRPAVARQLVAAAVALTAAGLTASRLLAFLLPEGQPAASRRKALLAAVAAGSAPLLGGGEAYAAAGDAPVFVDSAIFERLEHFKDFGLPATLQDPIARAAIADGTCRSVVARGSGPFPLDGYDFWHHNPERVNAVLKALSELPPTSSPSKFVRAAKKQIPNACFFGLRTETSKLELYQPAALAKTVSQWHKVLCSPLYDDPAEEPQQQALTVGFICMVVCDTAKMKLSANAIGAFSANVAAAQAAAKNMCAAMPWTITRGPLVPLDGLKSFAEIATATTPWRSVCGCTA